MRKVNKILGLIAVSLSMVSFSSCSPSTPVDPPAETVKVETIFFQLEKNSLYVGDTTKITNIQVFPDNATNKKVTFRSDDLSVIKINNDIVEATGVGSAYVIASSVAYPEVTFKVKVNVIKREVPVTGITLELPHEKIEIEETMTASVSVSPSDATNKDYELIASPSGIVSISGNKITGLQTGTVSLKAKSKSNDIVSNIVTLEVTEIAAKGIELSSDKTTLYVGETSNLSYTVIPDKAKDKEVAFKTGSETNNVIEISSTGVITAKAVGEDYAIAYMVNKPEVWNRVKITVIDVPVSKINLYASKTQLEVSDTVQLTSEVLPINATFKTVAYKTKSNTDQIISVSNSGLVTANSIGKDSVICYSTSNPEVYAELEIEVIETPVVIVDVEQINLSASKTALKVSEEVQLVTEVLPENATNKAVTYATLSGYNNIIEVSNNGLVKAIRKGKDSVICKSVSNPEISKQIEFEVTEIDVESISVTETSVSMLTSETYQINATVLPQNATHKEVAYKVLDRNDYSDKGDRFESAIDYSYHFDKPLVLNDLLYVDVCFDELESTQKFSMMLGQGWGQYFGYYDIFSDGTLGGNYAGVSVSEPVEGLFRFTFDLSLLNKQADKPLPDEYVDLFYIRGQWSLASGYVNIRTSSKQDILSVNSTGLVSAFNIGEQKVRVYSVNQPSIYQDITFNVTSNPDDPMGEDIFTEL